MIIRWRYKILGGHVHVRVFTSKAHNFTFAKCGDLCFGVSEWNDVRDQLYRAVEFIPEESIVRDAFDAGFEATAARLREREAK